MLCWTANIFKRLLLVSLGVCIILHKTAKFATSERVFKSERPVRTSHKHDR